ncbi:MAG: DUF4139 domain-containing protein [Bacteroidota bacterium]|nr:DUF4139 domain-containing protein [Bacteroidota bacterium]
MHYRIKLYLIALLLVICNAHSTLAAEKTHIFLYLNNYAYIQITDTLTIENGKSYLRLPINTNTDGLNIVSNSNKVKSITIVKRKYDKTEDAENLNTLLSSNIGKRVKIVTALQDPQEGYIQKLIGTNYLVIKTKDKWLHVAIDKIESVEFLDQPSSTTIDLGYALEITWEKPGTKADLQLGIITQNAGWKPEYQIVTSQTGEAEVVVNARIENNTGLDWKDAIVTLVNGKPYINVKDIVKTIDDNEVVMIKGNSNWSSQQGLYETPVAFDNTVYNSTFTLINTSNINLPNKNTATIKLNDIKVAMLENYVFDLDKLIYNPYEKLSNINTSFYARHTIRLTNTSGQAWIEGQAFINKTISGQTFLTAVTEMPTTGANIAADVLLENNSDITLENTEIELKRKEEKDNDTGNLVRLQLECTMRVKNLKAEIAVIDIKRDLDGKPEKSSETWETIKVNGSDLIVNPQYELLWKITLRPGEEKIIFYTYSTRIEKAKKLKTEE